MFLGIPDVTMKGYRVRPRWTEHHGRITALPFECRPQVNLPLKSLEYGGLHQFVLSHEVLLFRAKLAAPE